MSYKELFDGLGNNKSAEVNGRIFDLKREIESLKCQVGRFEQENMELRAENADLTAQNKVKENKKRRKKLEL